MKPGATLALAGLAFALAAWVLWQRQAQAATAPTPDATAPVDPFGLGQAFDSFNSAIDTIMNPYSSAILKPENQDYVTYISSVEQGQGIPAGMLVRLAWQESHFRADIISGATVSSAGAKGMFQLMPVHWQYVDPTDWRASANYAGHYLASLYRQFGDWAQALAAYNWGPGNVANKGMAAAPAETVAYFTQILSDIGLGALVA